MNISTTNGIWRTKKMIDYDEHMSSSLLIFLNYRFWISNPNFYIDFLNLLTLLANLGYRYLGVMPEQGIPTPFPLIWTACHESNLLHLHFILVATCDLK